MEQRWVVYKQWNESVNYMLSWWIIKIHRRYKKILPRARDLISSNTCNLFDGKDYIISEQRYSAKRHEPLRCSLAESYYSTECYCDDSYWALVRSMSGQLQNMILTQWVRHYSGYGKLGLDFGEDVYPASNDRAQSCLTTHHWQNVWVKKALR